MMSTAMAMQIRDETLSYLIWFGFVVGLQEFELETDDDKLTIWIRCDVGEFSASINWNELNSGPGSQWHRALAIKSIAIALCNANLQRDIYE